MMIQRKKKWRLQPVAKFRDIRPDIDIDVDVDNTSQQYLIDEVGRWK